MVCKCCAVLYPGDYFWLWEKTNFIYIAVAPRCLILIPAFFLRFSLPYALSTRSRFRFFSWLGPKGAGQIVIPCLPNALPNLVH